MPHCMHTYSISLATLGNLCVPVQSWKALSSSAEMSPPRGQETECYVRYLPKVEKRNGPWVPNSLLAGPWLEGSVRQEDSLEVAMQYVCQVQD